MFRAVNHSPWFARLLTLCTPLHSFLASVRGHVLWEYVLLYQSQPIAHCIGPGEQAVAESFTQMLRDFNIGTKQFILSVFLLLDKENFMIRPL